MIASPFKYSSRFLSITMETVVSTVSVAEAALGSSISMDSFTMYTEATMKITSSTNITSTSGVTLISLIPSSSSIFAEPAMSLLLGGDGVGRADAT